MRLLLLREKTERADKEIYESERGMIKVSSVSNAARQGQNMEVVWKGTGVVS